MTRAIKLWPMPGGIHPPEHKQQSMQLPLGTVPIPPQLFIPLNQHIGAPAKAIVTVGEQVLAGQLIATADGTFSANIHASSSGTVSAIGDYALPHPSGMHGQAIVINTDGSHQWAPLQDCQDYLTLDRLALLEKIRAAGVAGLGGAGFPTAVKLYTKSTQQIDTLVINGAECEPYITADDMLMQVRAEEIIAGTLLLSHILHHPARLIIAVEDNKPKAIAALQLAAKNYTGEKSAQDAAIEVLAIPTLYPSGGARQLVQILTGREIPHGHHSADIGAICVNVATTAAAWRAVRFGEPLISRITTVTGEALKIQRNIEVLLGTPIEYVLTQHGFAADKALRVVMGGSMMGFTLPDLSAPVIKTTNCLLAASKKELPPPPPAQACIRCGICAEACPASLLPQQLFWYAQAEDSQRLQAHNIFDCIECGACSYVCPSKIPLVQYYRAGKGMIRQQTAEKEKADRSRQRFEFRKLRIEKEEAEKEAKRAARKKAAEEAKQQLANRKSGAPTEQQPDMLATALSKASQVQATPAEQRVKLERMLQTARNGLASARAPLVARNPEFPITEVQLVQQQSRIKQMELKLVEAEKRLADFDAQQAGAASASGEDPVAAAMARAKEKMAQPADEKLRTNLELMQSRFAKAQEKAQQATADGSPAADALQKSLEKMQQKIAETEAELAALATSEVIVASVTPVEENAAQQAMAKARAKAATLTGMSDQEKQAEQLRALQSRLQKARERLQDAERENAPNIEALRIAVSKLEEKIAAL
ncbi:MAG TPA: electron transport complex subunit RsxC [Cellvibrio sp.]|nr:electron transport complex subunit RsxC [Cellvibrio sp.]